MFSANQVPDTDRMQPRRATNPARTDERRLTRQGQKNRFGASAAVRVKARRPAASCRCLKRSLLHQDDILAFNFNEKVGAFSVNDGLSIQLGGVGDDPGSFVGTQKHDALKYRNQRQYAGEYTKHKSIEADRISRYPKRLSVFVASARKIENGQSN
jgi:hypothetical protein